MSNVRPEKLYTVDEFLQMEWPDDDEKEYELVQGKIVAKPEIITGKEGKAIARIATCLNLATGFLNKKERTGTVYVCSSTILGQPQGLNLPMPDVCFVLNGLTSPDYDGPIPVAPDLVVEVNSPSDTDERKVAKLNAYREAGVSVIWSVSILEKYVMVYSKNRPYPQLLNLDDELDGEDVIPGFRLKVRALFE